MSTFNFVEHYLDDKVPGRGRVGRFYVCRLQVGGNKNAALFWEYLSGRFQPLRGLDPGQAPKGAFIKRGPHFYLANPREEWARLAGMTLDEYDSGASILKAKPFYISKAWPYGKEGKTHVWISVNWSAVPKFDSVEYELFEGQRRKGFRVIGGSSTGNKEPLQTKFKAKLNLGSK